METVYRKNVAGLLSSVVGVRLMSESGIPPRSTLHTNRAQRKRHNGGCLVRITNRDPSTQPETMRQHNSLPSLAPPLVAATRGSRFSLLGIRPICLP